MVVSFFVWKTVYGDKFCAAIENAVKVWYNEK